MSSELRTPFSTGPVTLTEKRNRFRKQILPVTSIVYNGRKLDFTRAYLADLAKAFTDGAYDQVPFLLADADNRHTMQPERWRGQLAAVDVTDDGLYGEFDLTDDAADLVRKNPHLGVSARIVMNPERADGRSFGKALQHVLGTLDPKVTGMKPWEAVSLSAHAPSDVADLSTYSYEKGAPAMPTQTDTTDPQVTDLPTPTGSDVPDIGPEDDPDNPTTDDTDADSADGTESTVGADVPAGDNTWTEDELVDALDALETELDAETEGNEGMAPNSITPPVGASLSTPADDQSVVDLAAQLDQVRDQLAASQWANDKATYTAAGVPPALLDLAEPVLARHTQEAIELSNGEKTDAASVLRGFLDAAKGLIDLSEEQGHSVDAEPDSEETAALERWSAADPDGF